MIGDASTQDLIDKFVKYCSSYIHMFIVRLKLSPLIFSLCRNYRITAIFRAGHCGRLQHQPGRRRYYLLHFYLCLAFALCYDAWSSFVRLYIVAELHGCTFGLLCTCAERSRILFDGVINVFERAACFPFCEMLCVCTRLFLLISQILFLSHERIFK